MRFIFRLIFITFSASIYRNMACKYLIDIMQYLNIIKLLCDKLTIKIEKMLDR
jgi:hypothetical protein